MSGPILIAEVGPFCYQIPLLNERKTETTQGLSFLLYNFQQFFTVYDCGSNLSDDNPCRIVG